VVAHTWYCNREMEEGVRLMLVLKNDSNGEAAQRRTKKVAQRGAPAARTRAQPRRGEEARRCSGFDDGGAAGSVFAMPGRRLPTMVWRGGEGAVPPARSSCSSDELGELHGSWARRSDDVEKLTALLELGARAVARRRSGEEVEDSGVEGGSGGIEGAASREAASRLGSLMAQNQISPRFGFRIGGVTPFIPGTFLVSTELCQSIPIMRFMVSTELCQSIPIMRFMVSTDLIQPIPKIFCIGWVTSADTNEAQPINTAHTPLFQPSTTVAAATVPTEISFFQVFFSTFSNMFLPFLPWYI
jgi:hypothetical protein